MKGTFEGTFDVTSWSEVPSVELEGALSVTTARFAQSFSGEIEASTLADMVMTYRPDGTAAFAGLHRVVGLVAGRRGSMVLWATGEFDGAEARTAFLVVEGSGTDEWLGVAGSGDAAAGHGSTGTYRLELDLPDPR